MRTVCSALVVAAALVSSACFQMTTIVDVKGDGSGTIDYSLLVSKAALARIRQLSALGGDRQQRLDLVSEAQAREMAATLGAGVTYVSSSPIDTPLAEGRKTLYSFADINTLRISQQPEPPAGVSVRTQALTDSGAITCTFTHEANGNALLRINLPEPTLQHALAGATPGSPEVAQQLAMVRTLLAGARILIAVEPDGSVVRTSSPYVDGRRVTLVDVNLDELLANEAVIARLQAARSADDLKAALQDVPGVKITLSREVTIEFTPAK